MKSYGSAPLSFEPNLGQTDSRVKYLARGNGYAMFLTPSEAVFELQQPASSDGKAGGGTPGAKLGSKGSASGARGEVVRMKLLGSNPSPLMAGLDELPGKSNYALGKDPTKWRMGVPTYRKVAEREVYPGINLLYYGNQRQLEYDFVVGTGADPRAIRFEVDGAKRLHTDSAGDLTVEIAGGNLRLHKPVVYQKAEGGIEPVEGRYVVKGKRQVAFQVGRYDARRALVIDPILEYSTYVGGSSIDGANAIAIASDGTAFITGGTFSTDFPTAGTHPLQPDAGGPNDFPNDAFVSKLSADGSTLLYSTYLGGNLQDVGNGIAVDTFGDAYVTGTTLSSNFPTTPGSFDPNCPPNGACGAGLYPNGEINSACFLTELNPAGSAILYSTYIGGEGNTRCQAVAVDNDQNAYVTGSTQAPTQVPPAPPPGFPMGPGARSPFPFIGPQNAFLVKIDSTGSDDLYAAVFGCNVQDIGLGVAVDGNANAYVTGLTYSPCFPVTPTAFQQVYGGAGDAFFTMLNTNDTSAASLLYSTFLGGNGLDQGNAVAVDSTGKAYVTGATKSNGVPFPSTPGAYQTSCDLNAGNCDGDVFVTKFDPTLSGAASVVYSTYLGGTHGDSGNGIAVDTGGNAYVTGATNSTDFPVTTAVFQSTYGGGNADAFVTKLDPTGSTLVYSSYLGGSNTDSAYGIAVDPTGAAYVAGQTCSLDFPLANPVPPIAGNAKTNSGVNCDAFVSKVIVSPGIALSPAGLTFPPQLIDTTSAPLTVTLDNGDNPLSITGITISGDYAETDTCGTSQPPGGKCTITVTFTPTAAGVRNGLLTINDNAPGHPHVVQLTGIGTPTGILTLSATNLTFGNQPVGSTSAPQAIKVSNTGTAALTIASIVSSGDYAETNNCTTALLQPTTTCVITVTFTPTIAGSSVGALTITDNAPGSPQVILLTGSGVLQPVVTLSANSLTFAGQAVGTSSAAQQVTVTNSGSGPLNIGSIVPSGDFTETNNCGASVPIGATCAISVVFVPSAAGPRTGLIVITDNAPTSPQVITLAGAGADFTVSASPSTSSIFAGSSSTFTLVVTPTAGFNSSVTLGCGLPAAMALSTCTLTPGAVTPNGVSPVGATALIATAARTMAPPGPNFTRPGPHSPVPLPWLVVMIILALLALVTARRRRVWVALGAVTLFVLLWAACGSGGKSFVTAGTPAGNYTITLSGTSGSVTRSATVTLTVN
ncbi:MAG TPA: choice-of-anchor D domain-containing protein [Terriglobia bacterium]|nr:choice-of-anchor D domain-containing protein [Terriglobia bacterium]